MVGPIGGCKLIACFTSNVCILVATCSFGIRVKVHVRMGFSSSRFGKNIAIVHSPHFALTREDCVCSDSLECRGLRPARPIHTRRAQSAMVQPQAWHWQGVVRVTAECFQSGHSHELGSLKKSSVRESKSEDEEGEAPMCGWRHFGQSQAGECMAGQYVGHQWESCCLED
jgi:hypothetical protein